MPLPTDATSTVNEVAPDEEIVRRVLAGDLPSFEILMRRYNQRLYRIARGIVADDDEAEDIVQEAYVRAFEHLGQFEGRSQFSTWLTKIAVYEASARQRKRHRLQFVEAKDIDSMRLTDPDTSEFASRRELLHVLAQAVDALPEDLREVVALRLIEGLSTAETAECLDLTPANVKTRLHRAKLSLRTWIDSQIGQEARQLFAFDGVRCDRIVQRVFARLGTQ